jgi:hypothetical protein
MPGFDGSGPLGEGPMTGGGFGYCGSGRRASYGARGRGFQSRSDMGRGFGFVRGRSFGRGMGRGYGSRRAGRYFGMPRLFDSKTELAELRQEAVDLKDYLKDVESRIAELEKSSE